LARLCELNAPRTQTLAQELDSIAPEPECAVTPEERDGLYVGGLLTPLEVIVEGEGDCDSKALLFACLLHGATSQRVALLIGCEHTLVGMEGKPRPGE
jgi:hypothetical protein